MTEKQLRLIYDKTNGHCHFCGDPVVFEKRGWADNLDGHWEVDHVIQQHKGGKVDLDNCLPACTRCNRLRWHRSGDEVRELLEFGLVARQQVKLNTELGRRLIELRAKRKARNRSRRKGS